MIIDNVIDSAALSVNPAAVATLPVANVQDARRSRVWRSTSTANQVITATLSEVKTINGVVLARGNFTAAATVRVRVKYLGSWVYDSGNLDYGDLIPLGVWRAGIDPYGTSDTNDLDPIWQLWLPDSIEAEIVEVTISDAGNPDGYIQLGRLFVGLSWEPSENYSWNSTLTWADTSEHTRTAGGSLRTEQGIRYRVMRFPFEWLDATDRQQLAEQTRRRGKSADLFVTANADALGYSLRDWSMICKFQDPPEFEKVMLDTYKSTLTLLEV